MSMSVLPTMVTVTITVQTTRDPIPALAKEDTLYREMQSLAKVRTIYTMLSLKIDFSFWSTILQNVRILNVRIHDKSSPYNIKYACFWIFSIDFSLQLYLVLHPFQGGGGRTQVQRGPHLRYIFGGRRGLFLSPPHVRNFVKEGYFFVPRHEA